MSIQNFHSFVIRDEEKSERERELVIVVEMGTGSEGGLADDLCSYQSLAVLITKNSLASLLNKGRQVLFLKWSFLSRVVHGL